MTGHIVEVERPLVMVYMKTVAMNKGGGVRGCKLPPACRSKVVQSRGSQSLGLGWHWQASSRLYHLRLMILSIRRGGVMFVLLSLKLSLLGLRCRRSGRYRQLDLAAAHRSRRNANADWNDDTTSTSWDYPRSSRRGCLWLFPLPLSECACTCLLGKIRSDPLVWCHNRGFSVITSSSAIVFEDVTCNVNHIGPGRALGRGGHLTIKSATHRATLRLQSRLPLHPLNPLPH